MMKRESGLVVKHLNLKIMINTRDGDFNPVITKEYLGYQYEIYLDAERDCLSGEILSFDGWYDSDSLTHLKEQIERAIELEVNYKYQAKLAEENSKLKVEIEKWKK